MSKDVELIAVIKRVIDSLCSDRAKEIKPIPRDIRLHLSQRDDEWNKLALEIAEVLQESRCCGSREGARVGADISIHIDADTDSWNKLALAYAERERKRACNKRTNDKKSSNKRLHTYA